MNADTEELFENSKKIIDIVEMHLTAIQEAFVKHKTAAVAAQLGFFAAGTANIDNVIKPYVCVCCGSKSAINPEWNEFATQMKFNKDKNQSPEVEK